MADNDDNGNDQYGGMDSPGQPNKPTRQKAIFECIYVKGEIPSRPKLRQKTAGPSKPEPRYKRSGNVLHILRDQKNRD